jgi:uncharacterized protein (TIGR02270 family)
MNVSRIQRPIGFRPWEISALVNREVIDQHAEEAAFIWTQRDDAVLAPNYLLKDLADLDERVEAHLDGLRVAGQIGWEICEEALGNEEPGEVFAAGVLAFESKDTERIGKVLEIGCSDPDLERGLISALGWLPFEQTKNSIQKLLGSERPAIRRVSIAAFAIHRRDPGLQLLQAISDQDERLRARALKAAGELGKPEILNAILSFTSDPDDGCRFFAAWSAARLGNESTPVLAVLREIAEAHGPYGERALDMVLRCMELQQAKAWQRKLRDNPEHIRLAVLGAGVIGDPDFTGDLIALMEIEEVARVAGEAFSMITGVDLEYNDLDGDAPERLEGGTSKEAEDEDLGMDPDEDLPWPVPELVAKWWDGHREEFRPGVRYLRGKEIKKESLQDALLHGNQRQRAAAALELAIMEPTQPLFEVRAPGKRQLKILKLK